MATSRPFAYNTGSPIDGTEQVGNLAIGYPASGFESTGLQWWNGPDEDLGYVIGKPVGGNNQPTPVPDDALFLSPTYKGANINLSNNNQTASQQFGYQMSVLAETLISGTDKVMFSIFYTTLTPSTLPQSRFIGVGKTTMNYQGSPYGGYPGNDDKSIGFNAIGEYYYNGAVVSSGLPTWGDGDIIDIVISHGQYWWIRVNGGNWNNNPSANPASLTGGLTMNGLTDYYPALCPGYEGTVTVLNSPAYGVPSGYNFFGNVTASVGFSRSNDLTDSSFISIANVIAGPSGPFVSASNAKTWLNANGYWTSYSGSTGGTGASTGQYALLNVYSPANSNGSITLPGLSGASNDPNTVGLNPGNGIYINKFDLTSADQSSVLDLLIGRSGTLTLTQGSNFATYSFTSTAFNFTASSPYTNQYWWDNFHNGPQSPLGTITVTSPASTNFNYVDPITITVT